LENKDQLYLRFFLLTKLYLRFLKHLLF